MKRASAKFSASFRKWLLLTTCSVLIFGFSGCVQSGALRLSLPESRVPYDQAWQFTLEASLLFHDRIVIEDKSAGFFQTSWDIHQVGVVIGTPVRRSRLIGRVVSQDPFILHLDMEQQAFSLELGRWVKDAPDQNRLLEIKERLRARLRL